MNDITNVFMCLTNNHCLLTQLSSGILKRTSVMVQQRTTSNCITIQLMKSSVRRQREYKVRRGSDRRGGRGVTLTLVDLRSHFPRLRVDVGKSLDNDTAQVTSGGNTFVVHQSHLTRHVVPGGTLVRSQSQGQCNQVAYIVFSLSNSFLW